MAYDRRRNSEKYCEPTFGNFKMDDILRTTDCRKHKASHDQPCWHLFRVTGSVVFAVCNSRARRAGFHGKISPTSLNIHNRGHAASKEK